MNQLRSAGHLRLCCEGLDDCELNRGCLIRLWNVAKQAYYAQQSAERVTVVETNLRMFACILANNADNTVHSAQALRQNRRSHFRIRTRWPSSVIRTGCAAYRGRQGHGRVLHEEYGWFPHTVPGSIDDRGPRRGNEICRCFLAGFVRVADIHVSHCQGKSTSFLGALGRARIASLIGCSYERLQAARRAAPEMERSLAERSGGGGAARSHHFHFCLSKSWLHRIRIFHTHVCLSAGGPCIPAGPDIHLLSKTPKSPHRRLSLCSLPVPKQFEVSLGSLISFAQSAIDGTWQPAHRNNPDVFSFLGRFFHAAAVALNTSAGTKSSFLRSTASRYATSFLATASVARFAFPRPRSFS